MDIGNDPRRQVGLEERPIRGQAGDDRLLVPAAGCGGTLAADQKCAVGEYRDAGGVVVPLEIPYHVAAGAERGVGRAVGVEAGDNPVVVGNGTIGANVPRYDELAVG